MRFLGKKKQSLFKKKRMRKIQSLALTGFLLAGIPFSALYMNTETSYADSYWAQPYLQSMVNQGIMTGNSRGNLNPSDQITRAEFVTMVNRAMGFSKTGTTTFTDVADTDWYHDAISIGAYEGYFQGVGGGLAAPTSPITREAAVTMLSRALKLPTDPLTSNRFTDNSSISNWSRAYVNTAVAKGFIGGYADGSFSPRNNISRAEVAKVIGSLTGNIVDESRQVRLDYVNGNVTLTASGGGLKNTVIAGDLYITDGVKTGNILLDNVTVLGQIIVSGAGESQNGNCSISLRDCDINDLIVDVPNGKTLSLITQGNTIIRDTTLKSDTYLDSSNSSGTAFTNVTVNTAADQKVNLAGPFANVTVIGEKNNLNLQKGNIGNLTFDEDAAESTIFLNAGTSTDNLFCDGPSTVTGTGNIGGAVVNTSGTAIQQLPEDITIRPGVTTNINGQDMTYSDATNINTLPEILTNYPKISNENTTSVTATFKANKASKLYWAVVPEGYAAPTPAQLINPNLMGSITKSGNVNISEATDTPISVTGLTMGTRYIIYGMAVDSRDKQSAIKKAEFSTVDTSVPKFTYNAAEAQAVKSSDGTYSYNIAVSAAVSKNAEVYYVLQPTGRTAPAAADIVNQRLTAAAKGHRTFEKDITGNITITGLTEATVYDLYMVAVDDNGRQSTVYKTTVTTQDTTAPTLTTLRSTSGGSNISVSFTPDENCSKVYWALYYTNSATVSTIEQSSSVTNNELVWYETDAAKDVIVRAPGAIQSNSSLTAVANTARTFNISGLESERYYKLYMVLEDASGNRSVAYMHETSTIDASAPEVSLSFGSTDGTNLYVGSADAPTSLSIVFDEVVLGRSGTATEDLTKIDDLSQWIKIYKGGESAITDSSKLMNINWKEVTKSITAGTAENPEHTVLQFTVSNTNTTALNLNTGETYTFVFTYNSASNIYLMDKSGNSVKVIPTGSAAGGNYTALTKSFNCVDPSVIVSAPAGLGTSEVTVDDKAHNLDLTYRVTPTTANSAASDTQKYDFYIAGDENAIVNILRQKSDGNWEILASDVVITKDTDLNLESAVSLTRAEKGTAVSADDYESKTFNNMAAGYNSGSLVFGLEVTQYNFSYERSTWNGSINTKLTCVVGTSDYLYRKANAPSNTTISLVTMGSAIDSTAFTDEVAPLLSFEIVDEDTDIQETTANVMVTTDKDVTLYWVAIKGELNSGMRKTANQVYSYIMAQANAEDVYGAGGVPIQQLLSPQRVTLEGLSANTEYHVYFVARSKAGNKLTEFDTSGDCVNTDKSPQVLNFKTDTLAAPVFQVVSTINGVNHYVNLNNSASSSSQMSFTVLTDRPADVYWTVCTEANYNRYDSVIKTDPMEIKQPTIASSYNGASLIEVSGLQNSSRTANTSGRYETTINVSGLTESTSYYLYALATNIVDNTIITTDTPRYVSYGSFIPPDKKAPKITDVYFPEWFPGTGSLSTASVRVSFDKPLYYMNNSTITKVTQQNNGVNNATGNQGIWSVASAEVNISNLISGASQTALREYTVEINSASATQITAKVNYINSDFTTVRLESTVPFCNSDGTMAGNLRLTYRVNKTDNTCTCTAELVNNGTVTSTMSDTYAA